MVWCLHGSYTHPPMHFNPPVDSHRPNTVEVSNGDLLNFQEIIMRQSLSNITTDALFVQTVLAISIQMCRSGPCRHREPAARVRKETVASRFENQVPR